MRQFDTLKMSTPPLAVVPGSLTIGNSVLGVGNPGQVGDAVPGTDYFLDQSGWNVEVVDNGPLSGSGKPAGPYYILKAYYQSKIDWVPFARDDVALTPLGQDVWEGVNFAAFHTPFPEESIGGSTHPGWNGVDCRVLDMWTSDYFHPKVVQELAWNGWLPGTKPGFPLDVYSSLNMPRLDPTVLPQNARNDQIISARYRQMVSSTTAPSSQYLGGQLITIHDATAGGNASMSDCIYHTRYVYMICSNNGANNIRNPALGSPSTYNYAKVGFFVPAAQDTLSIGLEKIESDAEWATLARRGANR